MALGSRCRHMGQQCSGSDWTNGQDSESYQERFATIRKITDAGSLDQLREILESGWDVNQGEPLQLLSYAIINSRISLLEIVQLLLEYGADPNVAHQVKLRECGETKLVHRTSLHEAARLGLTDVVKLLLDAGAKCVTPDASENPLSLALKNRDCSSNLVELLLRHGADPNDHDDQMKYIPLLKAIVNHRDDQNDISIVKLLLKHGANPNVTHRVKTSPIEHRTALHEAVCRSWTEGVKILLDAGAKCKISNAFQNPLVPALESDCPDLIELLLKHGADPNAHDDQFANIPLMRAITNGCYAENNTAIVQLLEHGANPNVTCMLEAEILNKSERVQWSALHEAVKRGWTEGVKLLLQAGAKCTTSNGSQNLLALALTLILQFEESLPNLIELLLKHGASPNDHDYRCENIPLLKAIVGLGHIQNSTIIIQLLLEHGANPNIAHRVNRGTKWVHRTALHEAARRGLTEVVKMLLDAGAKCASNASQNPLVLLLLNCGCPTALQEAVKMGSIEVVKMLLGAGAECVTSDTLQNPLALALQNQDCPVDMIELLLKQGADPNLHKAGENIPLLNAISNCRNDSELSEIVQLLLEHGANPNVTHIVNIERWGEIRLPRSALHIAARRGCTEVVKMLVDAGAKCMKSDVMENPLALALVNTACHPDLIKLLLKCGADPNDNNQSKDPLQKAIENCRYQRNDTLIVQLLLEHGANPNVAQWVGRGSHGKDVHRTALQQAARLGLTEVVKILLDAGAQCVTPNQLENPLMLALQNEDCHLDLLELLLKHGADPNYHKTHSLLYADLDPRIRYDPLLHYLVTRFSANGFPMFLQQPLDIFFLHGGNINMYNVGHSLALEHAVRYGGHEHNVRWLIRHGADPLLKFTLLKGYFIDRAESCFPETPLILLQAGLRVSRGILTQLSHMEETMTTWLQEDNLESGNNQGIIQSMWAQLAKVEEEGDQQRMQSSLQKSTFFEYWPQQMVDLQEFSDESLHVYPENNYIGRRMGKRNKSYQETLELIHNVLEFLSQPQSLQWYCRRCVRENLVSLQPSVVKSLPGPSRLKRYIMCHEI